MKISIVDIGSNAVKYKIFNSENFELVEYYREPLRLGRDVFSKNELSESTINKLIDLLIRYSEIFKERNIEQTYFIATSAVRDSENSDVLISKLEEENIHLKILTGKQEASLLVNFNKDIEDSAVIDIGGGSVEVCINSKSNMHYESFQLGAVRLLNLNQDQRYEAMSQFGSWLEEFTPIPTTFGLGGNLRAIMQANDHQGLIHVEDLKNLIDNYNRLDEDILVQKFEIPKDRIDIVPIAAEIYLFFLSKIGAKTIENSFSSISDGLVRKVITGEL
mgnify:FL=1|tara:strand:+ start:146 stop:973 length:828 start_codon:yes stop_codon:yes gene_type:complete